MTSIRPAALVGVDVGGTFTDFYLVDHSGVRVHKTPTTAEDPSLGVLRGLRDLGDPEVVLVVHGSTVATNAVLEGKGAKTALVTTEGFEDVLEIGRQDRRTLYDIWVQRPSPLVPRELRFGAPERVASDGSVIEPLTEGAARRIADQVLASGADSVAISCLFSFLRPEHERLLREALTERGVGPFVYMSHEVLPEYREYERTSTTVINAFVAPSVHGYLSRLADVLRSDIRVIQSSGGSVTAEAAVRRPVETISGGPAGGVVGAYRVAKDAGFDKAICFDMGGTSTDVSLCDGTVPTTNTWTLAGFPIGTPAIDIHSIGAGGGSIARIDPGGALRVGPESAGADPGPAAYGSGEEPTVTDADLVLGRLGVGDFTVSGRELDLERARAALRRLGSDMGTDKEAAAGGVVKVAVANMARAIRVISVERGFDPRLFTIVAFGGAGPVHACEVADSLDIRRVLVPTNPGVLSAMGMTVADITRSYSSTVMLSSAPIPIDAVRRAIATLVEHGLSDMGGMDVVRERVVTEASLDMRYRGQSFELNVPFDSETADELSEAFHEAHRVRFGHAHEARGIEIVNVRVRTLAPGAASRIIPQVSSGAGFAPRQRAVFFGEGVEEVPILDRADVGGDPIVGPAILTQYDATTVVPPKWSAQRDARSNLILCRVT